MIQEKPNQSFSYKDYILEQKKNANKTSGSNSISLIEKVIVSDLKNGEYKAFSSIFSAYYRDLVIFASKFTRELTNAEEIVEDTFVKLWEERKILNIKTSLKSYLLKMVQNKCIDRFRHNKIVEAHLDYTINLPHQYERNTDSYLLYSELNEQVENVLSMLPEQISETFRMNREKGLKYHEIADILGVSVRTVEVRIGKALNLLRKYLKDYLVIVAIAIFLL